MTIRIWILVASVNGFLAVAVGAAATHLFADEPRRLALMTTGAQYAIFHALALLALAGLAGKPNAKGDRFLATAAWLFIVGTVLFSASLYLLALTEIHALVWVTPFGGIAFILGWATLGIHAWRRFRQRP